MDNIACENYPWPGYKGESKPKESNELPQLTDAAKEAAYSIGKQYGLSRGQSCLIVRTALAAMRKEV